MDGPVAPGPGCASARRRRRAAGSGAVVGLTLLLAPATASAHGLVGRSDLPIPRWLFAWAAAVVLIASFVALAVLWPKPRLEADADHPRRIVAFPRAVLEPLCGLIGVLAFGGVVYAGFAGTQTATANVAPTVIYVLFWVGIPCVSLLLGDVFAAFNPWRAIARGVAFVAGRVAGDGLPAPLAYPQRLGRWPAVVGILAFAWVELVWANRDDPSDLALLALVYAAVQLVGMSLYGIEAWSRRGDAFGVYFWLFSRLSPLHWRGGVLEARRPLAGATGLDIVPGTTVLLCTMIGTTTFDGFSAGPTWAQIAPDLQQVFIDLGLTQEGALQAGYTLGLVVVVLLINGLYRLGVAGMRSVDPARAGPDLAGRFAHSLIPIALAYVVAHYFSLLAYQGQAMGYLASDPLGDGSDLLGTAGASIDYGVVSASGIWYVQVAALVLGHVGALVLAHDRALEVFRTGRAATRSQYWMLAVMVGFTSLGLWLLSAAA